MLLARLPAPLKFLPCCLCMQNIDNKDPSSLFALKRQHGLAWEAGSVKTSRTVSSFNGCGLQRRCIFGRPS